MFAATHVYFISSVSCLPFCYLNCMNGTQLLDLLVGTKMIRIFCNSLTFATSFILFVVKVMLLFRLQYYSIYLFDNFAVFKDREEELRTRMLEIRRKERERRHLERERDRAAGNLRQRHSSDSDSSDSSSQEDRRKVLKSRSPSPKYKRR